MPFEKIETPLEGLFLIKSKKFFDNRGFFQETFKRSAFCEMGIDIEFNQDNMSYSKRNVIRGMHYQKEPFGQAKLVKCVLGKIFDVVVDVRKASPTFAQKYSVVLDETDEQLFFVPDGFLHGFCVLSDYAVVLYKTSNEYSPQSCGGVHYDDKYLGIEWPVFNPVLSDQDMKLPGFEEQFMK